MVNNHIFPNITERIMCPALQSKAEKLFVKGKQKDPLALNTDRLITCPCVIKLNFGDVCT